MNESEMQQRIEYAGDLNPVFSRAMNAYGLGEPLGFKPIEVGYEDYNVRIETSQGAYFTKIFAVDRGTESIERYGQILEVIERAGVNHPKLYRQNNDALIYQDETRLAMVVMEFVEGETFFDMDRAPTSDELDLIMEQAARVNAIDFKPTELYDQWAIPHLDEVYEPIRGQVSEAEDLIERAIADLTELDVEALPHCFVHGDLTKSNVLKTPDGKMYLLDFSSANWYPRIQELAVIVGNLMNTTQDTSSFMQVLEHVVTSYVRMGGQLTPPEMHALTIYARAAYACEYVGALRERLLENNNTTENEYWLKHGLVGLKRSYS